MSDKYFVRCHIDTNIAPQGEWEYPARDLAMSRISSIMFTIAAGTWYAQSQGHTPKRYDVVEYQDGSSTHFYFEEVFTPN
jgi:hypothetical protein